MTINLGGRFNVANAVAAATCARALGIDPADIADRAGRGARACGAASSRSTPASPSRSWSTTPTPRRAGPGAPGGARELTAGRLLVVFGAGGDRDHDKRPLMGAAAASWPTWRWSPPTTPAARTPTPSSRPVVAGRPGDRRSIELIVEPDRAAAISVRPGRGPARATWSLIAGKGHEPGQEIAGGLCRSTTPRWPGRRCSAA